MNQEEERSNIMKLSQQDINYIVKGYEEFTEYCGKYLDCSECPLRKMKAAFKNKTEINTTQFCQVPYVVNYIRKQEKKNVKQEAAAQVVLDKYCAYQISSKPLLTKFFKRIEELGMTVSDKAKNDMYSAQKAVGVTFAIAIYTGDIVYSLVDYYKRKGTPVIFYNGKK